MEEWHHSQRPIAWGFRDTAQRMYQENGIGSHATVRANGAQYASSMYEYDAWGSPATIHAGLQSVHRFAGKHGYVTDESKLQLLGARYYIPQLGRFMTQDPIGQAGGINLYEYCGNNPLGEVDPDGLQGKSVGQPGFFESMAPVWGSGRAAIDDFQNGRWGWGIVNTALAVSDVFVVGTIAKSVYKLGVKASMNVGNVSWRVVRGQIREAGIADFAGQHFHHLIKQKYFLDSSAIKFFLNQPFMVTKLPRGVRYKGIDYSMQGWHMLLDGRKVHGLSMTRTERIWYGSNNFQKAFGTSATGTVIRAGRAAGQ